MEVLAGCLRQGNWWSRNNQGWLRVREQGAYRCGGCSTCGRRALETRTGARDGGRVLGAERGVSRAIKARAS